ncbi:Fpg/Nei family DNA glycosylase [Paenibacillus agricola]|uniref:Fpg/Nei family DNA glycosylase n=1 Tax=Paenibacillus agricola TaxID=2716264 RepID=A0ABX0J315_9BACL|nr:Fpg/Nei family DNA glycosylase [Paenibacillus agricola]NHN30725.1 Fpg/Nei family DNA glycosylase [Paenibacillus agricola]
MPELPEMENYKLLLSKRIVGKPITGVEVEREKSINVPVDEFQQQLIGAAIVSIERRAKHLLFHLSSSKVLVLHLMLGGMMFYGTSAQKPERTVQITISWNEQHLYFIGLRLGYFHLHSSQDVDALLSKLGPEPLVSQFTEDKCIQLLHTKKGTLKSTLVDQSVLSGIGNCYSDEICFKAGLLPARHCSQLDQDELRRLYESMQNVLHEAIQYGGYMEMPLFVGDTLTGGADARCRVYDREGEPCVNCGTPLSRMDVSSKKSFCCLLCQV